MSINKRRIKKASNYERLVQEIHQALVNQDSIKNITVEHDKILAGKSGASHQIDVYWEFTVGGAVYRTCIECKDYKSNVKKTHVAAFSEVLRDIGLANGIIVTTNGFQKGAIQLAEANNIRLLLINYTLNSIHMTMNYKIPSISAFDIVFDKASINEALKRNNIEKFEEPYSGILGEMYLHDQNGKVIGSIADHIKEYGSVPGNHTVELEDGYFPTSIGDIKILAIKFSVSIRELKQESLIDGLSTAKAIIEDVEGNIKYYLNDGKIAN